MQELLQNLLKEDKDFTEAKFKAKADNIFIQLYTAVMKQDLTRVKHFLSDDLYKKFEEKVRLLNERNVIQIYGELNVSETRIAQISENEDNFEIEVNLLTKYLDYQIDKQTKKIVSGDNEVRTEKVMRLLFTKTKMAKSLGVARKCQSCGANIDLNMDGRCAYCGTIFKLERYDWILKNIL
ncbi:MAG TPA: TIM44-like domain-containing protein [Clostridiaceae bacterium]|jgi:predicted lipid-binding transport protein (Tim44 family)|nr:TIM44-like domain-containing protein [Clostridiaceae bacterium]